jgi:AbiV family abortive infection protein
MGARRTNDWCHRMNEDSPVQLAGPLIPRRPSSYRGPLSSALIAEAMTAAMKSGARLLEDARMLAASGRHPSAVAMAILAIEEVAKSDILAALAVWSDPKDRNEVWRMFTTHIDKNSLGFVPLIQNISAVEQLVWLKEHGTERYFDEMKWSGLYVDVLLGDDGKPFCWTPEMLTAEHSAFFARVAERVVSVRTVTPEEIDLMRAMLHPTRGQTMLDVHHEVSSFLQAAVDRGIREFEPWMGKRNGVRPPPTASSS